MAESVVQVRVFTYPKNTVSPVIMPNLVQLAYETAIAQGPAPTMLLIRYVNMTSILMID